MVLPLSWQVKDEICLCFEGCGLPLDIPCCVFISVALPRAASVPVFNRGRHPGLPLESGAGAAGSHTRSAR